MNKAVSISERQKAQFRISGIHSQVIGVIFGAVSTLVLISWLACNCVSGVTAPGSASHNVALQCKYRFSGKVLESIRGVRAVINLLISPPPDVCRSSSE